MATTQSVLFLFLLLLLLLLLTNTISFSGAVTTQSLLAAAESLSYSGHLSMSLTLQLLLLPNTPSLTIFSPPDPAFTRSGQPSLSLLLIHFSPLSFPPSSFLSLPFGSQIPTLLTNHSLFITSNSTSSKQPATSALSLNGVKVDTSPLFDDGSLLVLEIEDFFNPSFKLPGRNQMPTGDLGCHLKFARDGNYSFKEASRELRSKGYSISASFLDLQLMGFNDGTILTFFSPVDGAIKGLNFSEYSWVLRRHIVPCKFAWSDLVGLGDGAVLGTYLDGYEIDVKKSGDTLLINDVVVSYPDIYRNDWLVVHGLNGALEGTEGLEHTTGSKIDGLEENFSIDTEF